MAESEKGLDPDIMFFYHLQKDRENAIPRTEEEGIKQLRGEYADILGIHPSAFEGLRSRGNWVSPEEHELICFENGFGMGLVYLAKVLSRSSRTTLMAVRLHNQGVDKTGFCQVCLKCKLEYRRKTASKRISLGSLVDDPDYR